MFSGIVETQGRVAECNVSPSGARLVLDVGFDTSDVRVGDSVCVSGVCLTVVGKNEGQLSFDAVNETLRRTVLGKLRRDSKVNIERSLKVGDRIHGHIVSGHVDAVTQVQSVSTDGDSIQISFNLPTDLRAYIAPKGSICVSGVSLTIGEVNQQIFSVYIVPHTAQVTTLGALERGDEVNLEVDMLARYTESVLKAGTV